MKRVLLIRWLASAVLAGALPGLHAVAQEAGEGTLAAPLPVVTKRVTSNGPTAAPGVQEKTSDKRPPDAPRISPVTAQVLKLMDAGVSQPVIAAYIEQAPIIHPLGAADLIALKQKGASDDLTVALLKRASASSVANRPPPRALSMRPNAPSPAAGPQRDARPVYGGFMDPESYDFWWYHYAYPRALAAANERLFSSYRPFFESPFNYGYYPPLGFTPQPPSGNLAPPP